MNDYDVIVVGGGPAGLAAALEADKAGAKVLVLERDHDLGGILQQCIHNGFGLHFFGEELTGPEYAGRFIAELDKTDIEVLTDTMVLEVSPERIVTAMCASRGLLTLRAGAVVLAMGCRERTRGALNIPRHASGGRVHGGVRAAAVQHGRVSAGPQGSYTGFGRHRTDNGAAHDVGRRAGKAGVRADAVFVGP